MNSPTSDPLPGARPGRRCLHASRRRFCALALLATAAGVGLSTPGTVRANTYTWTGGSNDNRWSDGSNWSGGQQPVSDVDTALVFAGTVGLSNTEDIAPTFDLNSLSFDQSAGAFTLNSKSGVEPLSFQTNRAGTLPTLTQNSAAAQTINLGAVLGSTLTVNGSGTGSVSLNGTVSGAGGLTQAGAGTLVLVGNNTYKGGTTFQAGTLQVGSAGALGTSGTLSFTGGTLQYSAANTTDYSGRFSQADNQSIGIDTNGQNVTFASSLTSNNGSLTKLGAGTLTLTGASTSIDTITVNAGTLAVTAGGASLTGSLSVSGTSAAAAATFNLSGGNLNVTSNYNGGNVFVGGDINDTSNPVGTFNQSGGTFTNSGVTVGQYGGTGTYNLSGTGILNTTGLTVGYYNSFGANAHGSTGTFTQTAGTLVTITGDGVYTGGIAVGDQGGTGTYNLQGGSLRALGLAMGVGGTGTFNQMGGTFTTSGGYLVVGENVFFGGNYGTDLGTGLYNLSSGSLSTGIVYVGADGTGVFTQTGGSFTTNGYELYVGYHPPSSTGTSTGNGTYNLSAGVLNTGNAFVGYGATGVFNQTGGTFNARGSQLTIGTVGNTNSPGTGTYNLSGGSLSTGNVYIGRVESTGTFTQTGGTFTTNGGTLFLGTGTSISTYPDTGTYNLQGGTLTTGQVQGGPNSTLYNTSTFHFAGGTLQAAASDSPADPNLPTTFFSGLTTADVRGSAATPNTGAVIDTQGYSVTVAQPLLHSTVSGDPAQDGGLTKLGTGTLTLSAANTYTGPTQVSAGTLAVTGSLAGTGVVTVANAATITGTGTVAGAVNVQAGGTLSPGLNGTGILTLQSSLTLANTATAAFVLGGTAAGSGYTQVQDAGELTLGGAILVLGEKSGFSLAVGQTFYLFDEPGSGSLLVSGTFGNAPLGIYTDAAGDKFLVNYAANNPADGTPLVFNDVSVTVVAVPEPSVWTLLGLGGFGFGVAALRRRFLFA